MDRDVPRVIGDFKIKRELGRGGMGVVYLARQLSLARDVALKLISVDPAGDPQQIQRFQREAALLARLSHPHIVQVYLYGEDQGRHFLAMELVEGTDLEAVLAARKSGRTEDLPARFRDDFRLACVESIRDVAAGLGTVHEAGIVHRDVKPSNILVDRDGHARIADFGLARDIAVGSLTQTGAMLGTAHYMSPERFGAMPPSTEADVFALGAVLYETLTGKKAFDRPSVELLMKQITEDDPEPPRRIDPSIPRDLEAIVQKCVEKESPRRYPDGAALARDLSRFLAGEPIEAVPVSAMTRVLRRARRRRTSLLATLIVAVIGVGIFVWGFGERSSRRTEELKGLRSGLEGAYSQGDEAEARRLLDEWLELDPDDHDARFERAELALRDRSWDAAAADFERLAATEGVDPAAEVGLHIARSIRQGIALLPRPEGRTPSAREEHYRALIHQSRKEYEEAVEWCRRAVEHAPDRAEAWYTLAVLCSWVGDVEGADRAFLEYRRFRPGRDDIPLQRGEIEMQKRSYDAAIVYFEDFCDERPESVLGWNNLMAAHFQSAITHMQEGRIDLMDAQIEVARAALAKAREAQPDYFLVPFNAAGFSFLEGRYDEAEQRFEEAIALWKRDPNSTQDRNFGPSMYDQFCRQMMAGGHSRRALPHLDDAIEMWPDIPEFVELREEARIRAREE